MGELLLDGHKLPWHMDRVRAWEKGERFAPVTIDMSLTQDCDARCRFCYAQLQKNRGATITEQVMDGFLEDCAKMGVRGISFMGDGENLLSPAFVSAVQKAAALGIRIAVGSNCHMYTPDKQELTLGSLSYLRINMPAGSLNGYCEVMGVKPSFRERVLTNIRNMVALKRAKGFAVTLGLQMVLMSEHADEVIPFVKLGLDLGIDYAVVKAYADDEKGSLGVDYANYAALVPLLKETQSYATADYQVHVTWTAIQGRVPPYHQCHGAPFVVQVSGTGLVAACGHKFAPEYSRFHIGNICQERWWDIWNGERYWEVMRYLASPEFDAQTMCGALCRQRKVNEALDAHKRGALLQDAPIGSEPDHVEFL